MQSDGDALLADVQRVVPRPIPPSPSRLRLALSLCGLFAYLCVVLMMTLSPTPLDVGYGAAIERVLAVAHRNGVPTWFGYGKLEFAANIVMFIPLGFLFGLLFPRRAIWAVILVVPALSCAIELTQGVFLAARFASPFDVVANTVGGYVGAICAIILRAVVHHRDQRVIARALWARNPEAEGYSRSPR